MCDYSKNDRKITRVYLRRRKKRKKKRIESIATILNVLATIVNNMNALFTINYSLLLNWNRSINNKSISEKKRRNRFVSKNVGLDLKDLKVRRDRNSVRYFSDY